MRFREWTRILPIWIIESWARTFSHNYIDFNGKKYIAFGLYGDMTLIIDEQKYWAKEKPKRDKEKELYEKKKHKAELSMLEIANKYPELKDIYFKEEEGNLDE